MVFAANNSAVQAAAEVTGVGNAVTVTTEYAGTKVPAVTMIMVSFSVLLILVVGIVGIVYAVKRFKNWGPGLISGIIAQLLFCFLLYVAVMFGISKIPGGENLAVDRPLWYCVLEYCITMVMTVLGVYLGIRYAVSTGKKRAMSMNVGLPLTFGAAFLLASLMEGETLTYPIQYIMISLSVNKIGFDPAVASMVEGGVEEEQAIAALLELVNANWFAYFCECMSIICSAVVNTCAAMIFYGVYDDKLQKKWLAYAFGGFLVFWIPGLINQIVKLPTVLILILMLVITAGMIWFTRKAVSEEMPREWEALVSKAPASTHSKKKEEPPKMPKIKMPD